MDGDCECEPGAVPGVGAGEEEKELLNGDPQVQGEPPRGEQEHQAPLREARSSPLGTP